MPVRPDHRRPPSRRTRLLMAAAVVALLVLTAVVVDATVLVRRVPRVPLAPSTSASGTTWLLLGSDSRERLKGSDRQRYADRVQARGERADVVLLLHRDAEGRSRLVSVPRDLYLGEASEKPYRLGLALQDGPQAVVDGLCRDLGVGIDHAIVVDFAGLVDAVDAAGGVTVDVPAPTRDRRAALDVAAGGRQVMDGRTALAWVRSRHPEVLQAGRWQPDTTADPSRSTHTAQVLAGLAAAADDPLTLQRLAWSVGPHLRRSDELGPGGLLALARAVRSAGAAGITTVPATWSDTEVPFAFVTPRTREALAPYAGGRCGGVGTD